MQVVSNSAGPSHGDRIAELLHQCDEAILVSPFLFDSFDAWIDELDLRSMRRLTVVTTLAPNGDDQLRKPAALLSLMSGTRRRWPSLEVVVQIDNRLHGKIYLFRKGGNFFAGVVTSANLTWSGLSRNHEWGILVSDPSTLSELALQVRRQIEYPQLSEDVLETMAIFVDQYRRNHPELPPNANVDASLLNALKLSPATSRIHALPEWEDIEKIFLKPIGDKDYPVLKADREKFGGQKGTLDFPRSPAPKNVKPGNIVITFGTGDRCVLGVHRVLDSPQMRSEAEQLESEDAKRWPWYVFAENLTPMFGDSWWEHAVTIDELAVAFQAVHRGVHLTHAGGDTWGAFNRGQGRLHVTDEFGRFAAERILEVEKSLHG